MTQSIFPGPTAPQNNPPINPQYYQPRRFQISNISRGTSTTVTTSVSHDNVVGQAIRILIQPYYGTFQLNEQQGLVISVPSSNQVVVNINSSSYNAFVPSPSYNKNPPQIVAIGDQQSGPINTGRTNNQTYIDGSFINISPA